MNQLSVSSRRMEAVNHLKNSAMEAETISKHGRSSKSQMSRGNFFRLSLALSVVVIASAVAFFSCKNDETEDPADLGKKAAQEWCDCNKQYEKDGNEEKWDRCTDRIVDKYEKYEDNDAFERAFDKELDKCNYDAPSGNNGGGGTILAMPTGMTAVQSGSSIIVSWNAVIGATSYNVYRWSLSSETWTLIGNPSATSYTDSNPLNGENHYFVTAVNNTGESGQDDYVSCNYSSGGGGGTNLPAPSNLVATLSGSSVVLTWNAVSGATGYKVYRRPASGSWVNIASPTGTSYTDNNPINGTNRYMVTAVNNAGESAQSNERIVDVTGGGGGTDTKPNTPTGVQAIKGGPAAYPYVTVSWNSVSGATGYRVYHSATANGTYSSIGTPTSTSYTHDNPRNGDNYYKVSAVNNAGESTQSSYAYCNTTASYAPCPPTVTAVKSGVTAKVNWTFPTTEGCGTPTSVIVEWRYWNNATNYMSDWKTLNTITAANSMTSGSYTASEFTSGQSISNYYRVTGTNGSGSANYVYILAGN